MKHVWSQKVNSQFTEITIREKTHGFHMFLTCDSHGLHMGLGTSFIINTNNNRHKP